MPDNKQQVTPDIIAVLSKLSLKKKKPWADASRV